MNTRNAIGVILSGTSTNINLVQVYEDFEGKLLEGMFLEVHSSSEEKKRILARILEIRSFNEYLEIGDIWSEARRKRREIPLNIARQYTILKIELLGYLPKLDEVTKPPRPGDKVYLIFNPIELFESIKKKEEVYIEFGSLYGYHDAPIPLRLENIPMHLAILGVTGSGKSYTGGYLIEKLGNIPINNKYSSFPLLIIDANGDYLDYYRNSGFEHSFSKIRRFVFERSEAFHIGEYTDVISIDLNYLPSRDLANLIGEYYSESVSELTLTGIEKIIQNLRDEGVEDINTYFIDEGLFKNRLIGNVDKLENLHGSTKAAVKRALEIFREDMIKFNIIKDSPSLNEDFVDNFTDYRELVIIDFSTEGSTGVSLRLKQLIVAYLSILLFNKFVKYKIERKNTNNITDRYMGFMIEEAQNYCPNLSKYPVGSSVARRYISLIATQGRKFGISLIIITQRPIFVDPILLSMINTFIIHRISPEDIKFIKTVVGSLPETFYQKLPRLETGTVILTGQMSPTNFPLILRVSERKIKPTMGTTNVSYFLKISNQG
ncbi:MAG: ATP-binding protein [Candidatus Njordarchaeia archaeon]